MEKDSIKVSEEFLAKEKFIVCVSGHSSMGKTGTIRQAWEKFRKISDKPLITKSQGKELVGVVRKNARKYGFETLGDPYSDQEKWIKILVESECEIIVAASRTHGETVNIVKRIAHQNNYRIIWFSPFYIETYNGVHEIDFLKSCSADAIINLIKKL